jgi:Domain of unknown function (DUF4399)
VSKLREILNPLPILTVLALVFLGGLFTYAVAGGSGSGTASAQPTPALHSITKGATQLNASVPASLGFSTLQEGATVNNPVSVAMAIAGIRYQDAGAPCLRELCRPVQYGYGHLGLIVDGPTPTAGDHFVADATHIDLVDGSYVTTLQPLAPGLHRLTAVWVNAADVITTPLLTQTVHITVIGEDSDS